MGGSKIRAVASALFALVGLSIGCSGSDAASAAFVQELTNALSKMGAGQELRMDAINTGEWTRLFVFTPYTSLSQIESSIHAKPPRSIESARLSERDDINLFVFLNGETVQIAATVPRNAVDFSLAPERQPLTRNAAVFKRAGSGNLLTLADSK